MQRDGRIPKSLKIFKSEWDKEVLAVGINEGETSRGRCQFSLNYSQIYSEK